MTGKRLFALDALRGVAAMVVLLHHAEREFALFPLFAYGYLAVDVFFLMSGYVIASAYEPRMGRGMGLRAFLAIRMARLYPMIWLGGLLGIIAGLFVAVDLGGAPLWLAGISAMTALPLLWTAAELFPLNAPLWSILFEIVTNALHRVLAPVLSIRVLGAILILSLALLLVAGWRLHGLANGFSPETFWGGFPRVLLSYFAGVLIWRTRAVWQPRTPCLPLWLLLAGFLAVVLFEVMLAGIVPASAYWLGAVLFAFPPGLMLLTRSRVPEKAERIAAALGDLSYPLYAIHLPLLLLLTPWVLRLEDAAARTIAMVIVAIAIALLSWGLERVYDGPLRRRLAPARAGRGSAVTAA
ncbi:MAG: acyltransferase [Novosphingobium sp.]|nr:acyltransferase [Novosphingobium sp.]